MIGRPGIFVAKHTSFGALRQSRERTDTSLSTATAALIPSQDISIKVLASSAILAIFPFMAHKHRAIFFDRDGIVNKRIIGDYVKRWEEFVFLPDIFTVLPRVHELGFRAIIITNQRGIGRNLMAEEALADIHTRMQKELLDKTGHRFDALYHCPDNDNASPCRKPNPGMIVQASAEHDIDLAESWMIGDSESDISAGRSAGCRTARVVLPGEHTEADITAQTLHNAWEQIAAIVSPQYNF